MEQLFLQRIQDNEKNEIMKCNRLIEKYDLVLSEKDVEQLLETKNNVLKDVGRIEFQSIIIQQLIYELCDSVFINKYNYVETLHRFIEIFYYYKDATEDYLSDEDIISYMKCAFEGCCQGSLDYLAGEQLTRLIDCLNEGIDIFEELDYGNI